MDPSFCTEEPVANFFLNAEQASFGFTPEMIIVCCGKRERRIVLGLKKCQGDSLGECIPKPFRPAIVVTTFLPFLCDVEIRIFATSC